MIENKFVYFKTRKAFESERDSGHINYDSIVFVEEGRTIYTHGTEFGVSQVQNNITNLNLIILDVSEELRKKIQDAIEQLLKENDKTGNDALSGIDGIDKKIEDLKKQLDALDKSKGTKGEISLLDGRIQAYTDYINKLYQTITKWYQDINAELGKMVTNGELVDYVNDRYNKYMKEVDLKDAALREELSTGTTDGLVDTVVGRIMDADEGIFSNYVQKTTYNLDKEAIQELIGRISAGAGTVTLEAIRNILDGDAEKTIAAKIFLDANGEGSTIKLDADRIDMTDAGETAVGRFIADLINAKEINTNTLHVEDNNHNTIDINNTVGIKGVTASDNSVGFHLKTDGSGEVANGNITWNRDGDLTIQNLTLDGTTFSTKDSTKKFNIEYIQCVAGNTMIKYSITSSGIPLKEDVLIFPDNDESTGVSRFAIDTIYKAPTTFGYLTYRDDKDLVGEWSTIYDSGFITPIYRWDLYFDYVTHEISDEDYNREYPDHTLEPDGEGNYPTAVDSRRLHTVYEWTGPYKYRYVNAKSILTFLAVRSFEYPLFDLDYNIIGHTKSMPNGVNWESLSIGWVDGTNGTVDGHYTGIGTDIDDSCDPTDTYWGDITNLRSYTGIKIDRRYRLFLDIMWKEIFSLPTDDLVNYPDGRKWLIEDGENIEVTCTSTYIYSRTMNDTQSYSYSSIGENFWNNLIIPENNAAVDLSGAPYPTAEARDAAVEIIRHNGYERTSTSGGFGDREYDLRRIPYKGTSHIKFKLNPYEFYQNAPDPEFHLHPNPDPDKDTRTWDLDAYDAWSLTVDESRFGWETW